MVKQPGKTNMSGTLRLYCVKFLGFLLALAAAAAVARRRSYRRH